MATATITTKPNPFSNCDSDIAVLEILKSKQSELATLAKLAQVHVVDNKICSAVEAYQTAIGEIFDDEIDPEISLLEDAEALTDPDGERDHGRRLVAAYHAGLGVRTGAPS